jgi:hypothetical protein
VIRQNSVFIDPDNCGSSVGYYITVSEYTPKDKPPNYSVSATVVLADCSHKIDWSFSDDPNAEKIEVAIKMLQEFKKKYLETLKLVEKLHK